MQITPAYHLTSKEELICSLYIRGKYPHIYIKHVL
jgi:hypothetical protein